MMRSVYGRNKSLLFKLEHELRQSLHHLLGMLELVVAEPLSPAQEGYLSECRAGADRLLQVANDVSELASTERLDSPDSAFSLARMVEEVAGIMTPLALRKGLEFRWSLDPAVPECVFSQRESIQDMLRRLLDNSIRFTTRGSVSLAVTSSPLEGLGLVLLIFDVIDTGPGIPQEIQDEFASPPSAPRTGFGLSVVRKRLEDINGELTVQSSTFEGATMRISLPVKPAAAPAPVVETVAGGPGAPAHASVPLKLLVAEDSNDSFNVFQVYVQGEGHTVSRALNGVEAVGMAMANEYDVILMDIDMPVMDGYTATRTIREWETRQGRARIPIVLLSAESPERQRRFGAAAGCSGYLTKPVPKSDVLRALRYFSPPPAV